MREVKKVKEKKSGDPGPSYVSCWPLFDLMPFVADTVKHRTYVNMIKMDTMHQKNKKLVLFSFVYTLEHPLTSLPLLHQCLPLRQSQIKRHRKKALTLKIGITCF